MEQLFNKFYSFSIEFRSLFETATLDSFCRDSNSQITLKQGKTELRFYILAGNAIRKKGLKNMRPTTKLVGLKFYSMLEH